jgi:membrane fusion protein (multidrug efflux system)
MFAMLLATAGCGKGQQKSDAGGRAAAVGYITVQPTDADVVTELPGRVTAFQSSEVRPQVSGIIRRRFFTEGSIVQRGQTLYEIDPRLYRAAVNEAEANLASARANADATRVRADRYKPLAAMEAVSKQDYTDAAAQASQAGASVQQTRAALETARINLQFTKVPAPITGRIGRSLFTEGALVTASQTDPLTTIQRLDPIFVDIQQSSADLLALRRALAGGGLVPTRAAVKLKLEDGSDYGETGSIQFSEVIVAPDTGTVTLRAQFPNRQGILYPGMFVRAVFSQAVNTRAFLVPQSAVTRDRQGNAQLWVVGPGDKALQKTVKTDRTSGSNWVVSSGLEPGDRVLVQGIANLRPNAPLKPVPADAPQDLKPQQQNDGSKTGNAPKAG